MKTTTSKITIIINYFKYNYIFNPLFSLYNYDNNIKPIKIIEAKFILAWIEHKLQFCERKLKYNNYYFVNYVKIYPVLYKNFIINLILKRNLSIDLLENIIKTYNVEKEDLDNQLYNFYKILEYRDINKNNRDVVNTIFQL